MKPDEVVDIKTVTLEKLPFGMQIRKAEEMPMDHFNNYVLYEVRGYVYSQDAGKRIEIKYPADWWEAFKERWLPFLDVKYIDRSFEVKATYPDLMVQSHSPVLRLLEF